MGRVKKTILVVVVITVAISLAVVVYICLRIFGRRRNDDEEEVDDEDEVDSYHLALQKALVEKTPLAVQSKERVPIDNDESLMVCNISAESQKYDQLTLWRKYQKLKAQEEERFCSLDNGKIKVQFYHQSYNQVFKMRIINARGLKCHVPNRALNTRVKILLITPLKTRNIPRQTRVIEQSNDPDFDQVLEINLTRKTTRDSTVEVSIWSIDDFYKESLIGGFVIDLKKYDVAQRNTVEEEIKIEFEEHENPGYIMVSLGYKREEEKLTAMVMRGRMLKCSAKEEPLLRETLNPYIKVYLYCDRKKIKKEKTEMKIDQINPVYNQVMEFLVPERTLDSTNLIIVVMDKDVRTDSKRNIGRIIVGANANGRCWEHWKSATAADGRVIAQWHQLWH